VAVYRRELEAAVSAALDAGVLLRSEFHRPGGPRGTRHHADADTEAEQLIHARLSSAFPSHGYFGEELGLKQAPMHGAPSWLVDPNDGTSAFASGYRGPAVSIGLVHQGRPVLGVVLAYSAPDDGGDLFTWAEGCGPLERNGRAVERKWPNEITPERTVLLPHPADRNPRANAEAVKPMRFRGVPSIAYRLALVAAGEGDATVSPQSPNDWDYAAGHALIFGAGADLFDSFSRPIRYSNQGRANGRGSIYAGYAAIAADLAARNWKSTFERSTDPNPFCRLERGKAVTDPDLLSRAHGCLLGQFCGDSLGSLVESKTAEEIAREYPGGLRRLADGGVFGTIAGQPTDDSEMALALARSIVREGRYHAASAAAAYAAWYSANPFGIGATTRVALEGRPNPLSQSNGALMRISPVGIAGAGKEPGRAVEWARADANLTHPNPICVDANGAFAAALAFAIGTGEGAPAIHAFALEHASEAAVQQAIANASDGPPVDFGSNEGWVLTALHNVFYQLLHAPNLEEGVVDTVMRGGDTDTNAAVTGALLGAVYGRAAIPAQWVDRVLTCRPIAGLPGVQRPRPPEYWPIDALCLAERLLHTPGHTL
jgi:ADP-ribosylglycohydrolase/fructose-1,6-bisphosphatase/inositol monophosphatase family enzyme